MFLNVNVLTNSFYIKECLCTFWKLQILSFDLLEGLSFEHGKPHITQNVKYNCVTLLLGYNQVFFHPEVLHFLPIHFPHIVSISGKPQLFSWERLNSKKFNLCMYILR